MYHNIQGCSSPCDNCDTSPTTCTSCLSNYPYFSSDSCFPNCPFGTYESSSYVCSGKKKYLFGLLISSRLLRSL